MTFRSVFSAAVLEKPNKTPRPLAGGAARLRRGRKVLLGAISTVLVCVAPLGAQTTIHGYPPDRTPYRDIASNQLITVYTGYYMASKDAIGAHPGSGALIGLRYEVPVSGPAVFFVRAARVSSKRTSYNPALSESTRKQGEVSIPLYLADLGFSFNLTGGKSWNGLVPIAGFGLGIANATSKAANDPYSFGTVFAGSTEIGVRYVPGGAVEGRVTFGNTFYQTRYPGSYFVNGTDGTSLLGAGVSKNGYRNNWVVNAGASVAIFR